uniref:GAG-pre-integrase domain-containing protein n=1 Tax=Fagus sylvatica TaxID=28930 RepID=A0A2N9ELW8_FAGSY
MMCLIQLCCQNLPFPHSTSLLLLYKAMTCATRELSLKKRKNQIKILPLLLNAIEEEVDSIVVDRNNGHPFSSRGCGFIPAGFSQHSFGRGSYSNHMDQFNPHDTRGGTPSKGGTFQPNHNQQQQSQKPPTQCQICDRIGHPASKCWYRQWVTLANLSWGAIEALAAIKSGKAPVALWHQRLGHPNSRLLHVLG